MNFATQTVWFRWDNRIFMAEPHISQCHTVEEMEWTILPDGSRRWYSVQTHPQCTIAVDGSIRDASTAMWWRPHPRRRPARRSWEDHWRADWESAK